MKTATGPVLKKPCPWSKHGASMNTKIPWNLHDHTWTRMKKAWKKRGESLAKVWFFTVKSMKIPCKLHVKSITFIHGFSTGPPVFNHRNPNVFPMLSSCFIDSLQSLHLRTSSSFHGSANTHVEISWLFDDLRLEFMWVLLDFARAGTVARDKENWSLVFLSDWYQKP